MEAVSMPSSYSRNKCSPSRLFHIPTFQLGFQFRNISGRPSVNCSRIAVFLLQCVLNGTIFNGHNNQSESNSHRHTTARTHYTLLPFCPASTTTDFSQCICIISCKRISDSSNFNGQKRYILITLFD